MRYEISLLHAAQLYAASPIFRTILPEYMYLQGRFCLKRARYIRSSVKGPRLTRYALAHPGECFLGFSRNRSEYASLPGCTAARSLRKMETTLAQVPEEVLRAAVRRADRAASLKASLPAGFCATLVQHIRQAGITR